MSHKQEKKILDTNMLSLLEERLDQEAILYKKYLNAAEEIYDTQLKAIFYESSQRHKNNFNNLLTYLKS